MAGIIFHRLRLQAIFYELWKIGVQSWFIVAVSSLFIGMVLAVQSTSRFRVMDENYGAGLVTLTLVRELGPALAAPSSRAGSAPRSPPSSGRCG